MSGSVYQVWRVDCHSCGEVVDYGEDSGSVPEECENCGEPLNDEETE
jgi:rRNA maturation endonuclease Nob1